MPRRAIPFVEQPYDATPGTLRMSEMVRRRGDDAARLRLAEGDISANLGMQIGNLAGQTVDSLLQYRAEKPQREAQAAETARLKAVDGILRSSIGPDGRLDFGRAATALAPIDPMTAASMFDKFDAQQKQKMVEASMLADQAAPLAASLLLEYQKLSPDKAQAAYTQGLQQARDSGIPGVDRMPAQFSPMALRSLILGSAVAKQFESAIFPKEPEPFTLNPGDVRFGPDGKEIASVPKPEPPPQPFSLSPGAKRFGPDGKVLAEVPPTPPTQGDTFRNPVAVMGPDGRPVYVDPREAVGKQPASSREQGRAVTSGDAGRIADLNTSLIDLSRLAGTLRETDDATGALAQLGASLWKPVTAITGWGTDAKKRQAVIDRVKQVIGKALEGGVLRKEDEIKYEKILPTIGDPPELAVSKLNGLAEAIKQRRQTTLDALMDAGYDTSKFDLRGPPKLGDQTITPPGAAKSDPLGIRK